MWKGLGLLKVSKGWDVNGIRQDCDTGLLGANSRSYPTTLGCIAREARRTTHPTRTWIQASWDCTDVHRVPKCSQTHSCAPCHSSFCLVRSSESFLIESELKKWKKTWQDMFSSCPLSLGKDKEDVQACQLEHSFNRRWVQVCPAYLKWWTNQLTNDQRFWFRHIFADEDDFFVLQTNEWLFCGATAFDKPWQTCIDTLGRSQPSHIVPKSFGAFWSNAFNTLRLSSLSFSSLSLSI